jgi:molecular chaperone DnaK
VSAKDLGTGKVEKLTIMAPQRLGQEEINRMVKDAEKFAEEDRRRRELAETKNQADSLVYATEKMLKELGEKISETTRKAVEEKKENLKKAIESNDIARLRKAIEDLNQEAQKIGTEVYRQAAQQAAQTPPTSPQGGASSEGVVDANFEEIDKDK